MTLTLTLTLTLTCMGRESGESPAQVGREVGAADLCGHSFLWSSAVDVLGSEVRTVVETAAAAAAAEVLAKEAEAMVVAAAEAVRAASGGAYSSDRRNLISLLRISNRSIRRVRALRSL